MARLQNPTTDPDTRCGYGGVLWMWLKHPQSIIGGLESGLPSIRGHQVWGSSSVGSSGQLKVLRAKKASQSGNEWEYWEKICRFYIYNTYLYCQCRKCKRLRFDTWVWKTPGKGNGNLLQYSCLENPMNRGAWRAMVHGLSKSWTQHRD